MAARSALTNCFDATVSAVVYVPVVDFLDIFPLDPMIEAWFSFARISFILYFCWSLGPPFKSEPEPCVAALLSILFMTTWFTRFIDR